MSRCLLTAMLCLAMLPLYAGERAEYEAIRNAHKKSDWSALLAGAVAYVEKRPGDELTPDIALRADTAARELRRPRTSVRLLNLALKNHPQHEALEQMHTALAQALRDAGLLGECIEQCTTNRKLYPEAVQFEYWRTMIAECLLLSGKCKDAESMLLEMAEGSSPERERAIDLLKLLQPEADTDAHSISRNYAGKYAEDTRFKGALARLPGYLREAMPALKVALGVELPQPTAVIVFRDAGESYMTVRASTSTMSYGYQLKACIEFYTEFVVLSEPEFRLRVIHEAKHAAFRAAMGEAYTGLPTWLKEGLAVYGAGQLEGRLSAVVTDQVFGGHAPLGALRGVERDDTSADYAEAALAFEWLENLKAGNVKAFCAGLLEGQAWEDLLARTSGLSTDRALEAANDYARKRLQRTLGKPGDEYMRIQDEELAAINRGEGDEWLKRGLQRYRDWLKANPSHLLAPNAMFRVGKGLILLGDHQQGRELLVSLERDYQGQCSMCDDAIYWIGRSHELAGSEADAARVFGVLLRDYSWCRYAGGLRQRYQATGPVTDDDAD
ncbi:MAG: hypothetical protein KF696_00640 [Planctomycetes bacterium]|nr:hypothetical protein [Planctomycetota bacterium]MCW8134554.1 hypothetical protein [Planctomycetota bacterium]